MAVDPLVSTVFLWDASDFDWDRGPMDLGAARRDGIDGFTHKATEGTWTKHVHFGDAMRRARDAGIPVLGAYHVVRSPLNAASEVDYCLSYVDQQVPWWRDFPCWFWQVDLEKWPYDSVPAIEGENFADIIEARTGRPAVIYASKGQYGDELSGTSHELWNANYGANPGGHYRSVYAAYGGDGGPGWTTYSGRMPIFWQFGSATTIGSQNTCDANAFRGTLSQLTAVLNGVDMTPDQDQSLDDTRYKVEALFFNRPEIIGGAYTGADNELYKVFSGLVADVAVLKSRPPVQPAPVDPAALKAVLLDPQVLAAIAKAVNDDSHRRSAE